MYSTKRKVLQPINWVLSCVAIKWLDNRIRTVRKRCTFFKSRFTKSQFFLPISMFFSTRYDSPRVYKICDNCTAERFYRYRSVQFSSRSERTIFCFVKITRYKQSVLKPQFWLMFATLLSFTFTKPYVVKRTLVMTTNLNTT